MRNRELVDAGATKKQVKVIWSNKETRDLMHNDVKQFLRGSKMNCVVVTNKSNMASYFSEVGNLNGSNNAMYSDAGDLFFSFQIDQIKLIQNLYIELLTTGRHLVFELDYNSHPAFLDVLHHYA